MLFALQRIEYQEDTWFKAYYDQIKNELHHKVILVKSHSNRIQVREEMQYVDKYYDFDTWTSLSPVMVKELNRHIVPLLDSGLDGEYLSVAFDIRMYLIEQAILETGNLKSASGHVKNIRKIAKYLITEKASVPQVLAKANDLKLAMGDDFWIRPTVPELERLRSSLRDLMPLLEGNKRNQYDVNITDIIEDAEYQPEDTVIDIRTYREKVIDYLAEHTDSEVIRKIHNLEPINQEDLKELEQILWHDLGTQEEYQETTDKENLAVFVRSLIGLSQEAVNEKFGDYLNGTTLNSQQQEFLRTIINYVRENGDVELSDLVNTEPFNNYDISELFGMDYSSIQTVVGVLHNAIIAAAA